MCVCVCVCASMCACVCVGRGRSETQCGRMMMYLSKDPYIQSTILHIILLFETHYKLIKVSLLPFREHH